jgi:Flp pilus assembly protein TadD
MSRVFRVPRLPWWLPALALAALVLAGCGRGGESRTSPTPHAGPSLDGPAAPGYVGMATCAGCHTTETADWTGSHHELAMARAADTTVLGDFNDTVFNHGGIASRFFRRDGGFFVITDGPDGELAEFELKWTFGWEPLQQYLVEFPDGRLQALGIAWDTRAAAAGGQRWFSVYGDEIIPAGDELHWTRPAQNWNYMCADCHSTGYLKNYDPESDSFASTWTDVNVACEACHGPGSIHVSRARADRLAEGHGFPLSFSQPGRQRILHEGATTLSIVGGEPGAMQVEACGRCHARRAPIAAGYRHGAPLLDSYRPALLEDPLYLPDGQILDEVFEYGSFRQSRMYAAGVVCTDCHQPHSLQLRAEGDAVCTQCHLPGHFQGVGHSRHEPGPGAPACRDCHMPARNYMVVDPRHDHSFRVPRPDLAVALGVTNACATCHTDRPAEWSADALRSWLGRDARGLQDFAQVFAAGRAGRIEAGASLRRIAADPGQPAIVRASALGLLRGYPGVETATVAIAALADPDPAVRLAALEPLAMAPIADRLPHLKPLWTDPVLAVRIEAARAAAGADPQVLRWTELEQLTAATGEYIEAQRASLDRPAAWLNLGNFHAAAGDPALAAQQYGAALALDPAFEPALVNLADLLFRSGGDDAANEVLARGLALLPGSAALHHATGLSRVRSGEGRSALAALARAAELAPGDARFGYVHAIALDGAGRRDEAIRELERINHIREADQDVLRALVSMNVAAGRLDTAEHYARQLQRLRPEDELLKRWLGQLGDEPAAAAR